MLALSGQGKGWDGHHNGDKAVGDPRLTMIGRRAPLGAGHAKLKPPGLSRPTASVRQHYGVAQERKDTEALMSSVKSKTEAMAIHRQGQALVATVV